MSRVGNTPIEIPDGIDVTLNEENITVKNNCKYCIKRNQLSLCCEIDCNRKVIDSGVKCVLCQ